MVRKQQPPSGGSLVSALYSQEEMSAQALKGVQAHEAIRDGVEDPFAQLGVLLCAAHAVETSGLLSRRQIAAFVAWAIGADLSDGEPMTPPIPPDYWFLTDPSLATMAPFPLVGLTDGRWLRPALSGPKP